MFFLTSRGFGHPKVSLMLLWMRYVENSMVTSRCFELGAFTCFSKRKIHRSPQYFPLFPRSPRKTSCFSAAGAHLWRHSSKVKLCPLAVGTLEVRLNEPPGRVALVLGMDRERERERERCSEAEGHRWTHMEVS